MSNAPADVSSDMLPTPLPVQLGTIFTEAAYKEEEQIIRDFFLERSHAYVATQRKATVDLANDSVQVEYTVQPGPRTVFGPTQVEGTKEVDPQLVLRELSYQQGEPFSLKRLPTQSKSCGTSNSSALCILPPCQTTTNLRSFPCRCTLRKHCATRSSWLKYSTRDEIGAQVEWSDQNWFGDGRQLSVLLQLASINRRLGVSFLQPHFLSPHTRALLSLRQEQSDEDTFLLNATRFQPRLEHRFSSTLSGFVGYRLEFTKLKDIKPATTRALGEITRSGIISGPTLGLVWNTTTDL
jgi:outer membrane protein assembly factor BamA